MLSWLVLFCLVLSGPSSPAQSVPVLRCPFLACLAQFFLSCPVRSSSVRASLVQSCPVLSLSCLVQSVLIRSCPDRSGPVRSSRIQSCPALPRPVLSGPVRPCAVPFSVRCPAASGPVWFVRFCLGQPGPVPPVRFVAPSIVRSGLVRLCSGRSCRVRFYLVLFCRVWVCRFCLVWAGRVRPWFTLPSPVLSARVRYGPVLSSSSPVQTGPSYGPILFCRVRSCPVLSGPVLSCPVRSSLFQFGPMRSSPVLSSPVLACLCSDRSGPAGSRFLSFPVFCTCLVLSFPLRSVLILSCPVLFGSVLCFRSGPLLGCPVLLCVVQAGPVLFCLVLSCFVLLCPVLSGRVRPVLLRGSRRPP